MGMELSEDFSDMFSVFFQVIEVNQDVIKIYNHGNIHHVREYVIHKMLEGSQCIGKSEGHNQLFKRPVTSPKGSFPLISVGNSDKMVDMSEIDFGVKPVMGSLAGKAKTNNK